MLYLQMMDANSVVLIKNVLTITLTLSIKLRNITVSTVVLSEYRDKGIVL